MKPIDETEKSQCGTGGGSEASDRKSPEDGDPKKPPRADDEVEVYLNENLPSEAEFEALAREIFLRLLPTIFTPEILAGEPTSSTRTRVDKLKRHSEIIADSLAGSRGSTRSAYALLRGRKARTLKFFS